MKTPRKAAPLRGLLPLGLAVPLALLALAPCAEANVSLDFSTLGTVFQDGTGIFYDTSGAGRTDVTSLFETDAQVAAQYWNSAISIPGWNESINFSLFDFSGTAVADSGVNTTDANGRPTTSTIRYGINSVMNFLDPTPLDNSEFTMSSHDAALGGGQVNVSQFGNATATGGAAGRYDVLTVDLHEIEHSLGYSSGLGRFLTLVGPSGTPGRQLTVPASLSGLPSDFNIPIVPNSAHIDGMAQGGLFNDTIVAEPGFDVGQRALPTDVEILGLGAIEGATPGQIHLGANAAVPEPSSFALLGLGLLPLGLAARRRLSRRA